MGSLMSQVESTKFVRGKGKGVTGTPRPVIPPSAGPVDYAPVYDEAALDRFAAAGRKAWADVPDAAQWVRELRGGT